MGGGKNRSFVIFTERHAASGGIIFGTPDHRVHVRFPPIAAQKRTCREVRVGPVAYQTRHLVSKIVGFPNLLFSLDNQFQHRLSLPRGRFSSWSIRWARRLASASSRCARYWRTNSASPSFASALSAPSPNDPYEMSRFCRRVFADTASRRPGMSMGAHL